MYPIERNLQKIEQFGIKREDENFRFRALLKGKDSDKIDKIAHRIYREVASQIDCTQCGNCCITLTPCLLEEDIEKLAEVEKIPPEVFIKNHTAKDQFDDILCLKEKPCRYLSDKKCSVYENRPQDCRSYPHLDKPCFVGRMLDVIDNYHICPIVFNVFERLKGELRFRR